MTDRRCWGYSLKDSKIFTLGEGEKLPKGYYDSPAKLPDVSELKAVPAPKKRRKRKAKA